MCLYKGTYMIRNKMKTKFRDISCQEENMFTTVMVNTNKSEKKTIQNFQTIIF